MDSLMQMNPNYYEDGCLALELCNHAYGLYLQQEPREVAKILHTILSNCTMDGVTLFPEMRKPFDIIVEGLSRLEWLPLFDAFRNPMGTFRSELLATGPMLRERDLFLLT